MSINIIPARAPSVQPRHPIHPIALDAYALGAQHGMSAEEVESALIERYDASGIDDSTGGPNYSFFGDDEWLEWIIEDHQTVCNSEGGEDV
jgi:hypothetical protein